MFANALKTKYLLTLSVAIELVLFYLYYFPESKLLLGDENRYFARGLSIANGGDWHNHPFWPPMQSLVIALFAKLFPYPILPLQIFQYVILLISGFIVRDITYRETLNKSASQVALAVMILYPSWLAYSHYLWPEVFHVFLFVLIIWINRYKHKSLKWMVVSGIALGLAILFKSFLILFIPFLYLPLLLKDYWKRAVLKIILSLLVAAIIITPASIKANKMTGGWMVANSSMFNLNLGLHNKSRQHFKYAIAGSHFQKYQSSAETFDERNTLVKQKAINTIADQGYVNTFYEQIKKQYFRLFDYQSFFSQQFQGEKSDNFVNKYASHHDTVLVKFLLFFNTIFYVLIMTGLILGIIVSVKKSIVAQQFALFLLYILGLFFLLHTIPRFRIPLIPLMGFYTGYLYFHCFQQKAIGNSSELLSLKNILITSLTLLLVVILVFSAAILDNYFPI